MTDDAPPPVLVAVDVNGILVACAGQVATLNVQQAFALAQDLARAASEHMATRFMKCRQCGLVQPAGEAVPAENK